LGVIVSALQVVQTCFGVVDIAAVAEGERGDRRRWRKKGAERVASVGMLAPGKHSSYLFAARSTTVEKIKEERKPEDFFGHRNRQSVPRVFLFYLYYTPVFRTWQGVFENAGGWKLHSIPRRGSC